MELKLKELARLLGTRTDEHTGEGTFYGKLALADDLISDIDFCAERLRDDG